MVNLTGSASIEAYNKLLRKIETFKQETISSPTVIHIYSYLYKIKKFFPSRFN